MIKHPVYRAILLAAILLAVVSYFKYPDFLGWSIGIIFAVAFLKTEINSFLSEFVPKKWL